MSANHNLTQFLCLAFPGKENLGQSINQLTAQHKLPNPVLILPRVPYKQSNPALTNQLILNFLLPDHFGLKSLFPGPPLWSFFAFARVGVALLMNH